VPWDGGLGDPAADHDYDEEYYGSLIMVGIVDADQEAQG
jgi:hypothetical protein